MLSTSEKTGCNKSSFCSGAIKAGWLPRLNADACAIQQSAGDEERQSNYILWQPAYKRARCSGNAFLNCDLTQRFDARKVLQESYLQNRGGVTVSGQCFGSGYVFTPEGLFDKTTAPSPRDMRLLPQQTLVPASCRDVVDMSVRYRPLPGAYAGAYSPLVARRDEALAATSLTKGVTLSNKRYPDWRDLKRASG